MCVKWSKSRLRTQDRVKISTRSHTIMSAELQWGLPVLQKRFVTLLPFEICKSLQKKKRKERLDTWLTGLHDKGNVEEAPKIYCSKKEKQKLLPRQHIPRQAGSAHTDRKHSAVQRHRNQLPAFIFSHFIKIADMWKWIKQICWLSLLF